MTIQGPEFDIVVVGGGLVGASLAYGMARQGARVALIDAHDVAFRASRANLALIWVQGKGAGSGPYAELTRHSATLWGGFARELKDDSGIDVHFEQPGGFTISLSEGEFEKRRELIRSIQDQPEVGDLGCEMVERAELEKVLPGLGPEVVGASTSRLDGHCNSLLLLRALYTAFRRLGGHILNRREVSRIKPAGDAFIVHTSEDQIGAGKVVLAAGLGNRDLAGSLSLNAPLTPLKGQILVTEKCAPFLNYPLVNMRQTQEGGIMIGGSQEDLGYDTTSSVDVMSAIASRITRIFPFIGSLNVVRSWAGLRVMTPDGLPLYEESADAPGAFVVNCHSGVTLAAYHAQQLAPAILSGGLLPSASYFSGKRFDVHETV